MKKKKKVHYNLFQLNRIGQVADEMYGLRNLFPEADHDITIRCLRPETVEFASLAFFKIATRGLDIEYTNDLSSLEKFHKEEKAVSHPLANYYENQLFEKDRLSVIDNTSNEILEATKEMELRVSQSYVPDEESRELEMRVKKAQEKGHRFAESMGSFFNAHFQKSSLAHSYLRMNKELFP